jgi:hypothetical protein
MVSEPALKRLNLVAAPVSSDETLALRESWRRTYARPLKRTLGVWQRGGFYWHVFSFEHTYALEGDAARTAYRAQRCSELIVLPNEDTDYAARVRTSTPPDLEGEQDVYISPPDFSWTMVFTHEDGLCGPYFCRTEWVDSPPAKLAPTSDSKKRRSRNGSRGR